MKNLTESLTITEKIDPQQFLSDYFSYVSIAEARTLIVDLFKAAYSESIYTKESPRNVVNHLKQLNSLVSCAYVFINQKDRFVDIPADNNLHLILFHLTDEQIRYPFKALQDIFADEDLRDWGNDLQETLEYSLSTNPVMHSLNHISLFLETLQLAEVMYCIWQNYYRP